MTITVMQLPNIAPTDIHTIKLIRENDRNVPTRESAMPNSKIENVRWKLNMPIIFLLSREPIANPKALPKKTTAK